MARSKKITDATRAYIFTEALSQYYGTGGGITDKVELIKEILASGDKGKLWVAEQVFGKATNTVITIQEAEDTEHEVEEDINTPIITWSDEEK
tara:strand:- start:1135 stop:1413 length:279 start_codon:yes stop_codon:yes gene_type:complete